MAKRIMCDCEVIHLETVNRVRERFLDEETYNKMADLYQSFSNPTRLKILYALSQNEMCVCDMAVLLNLTKSAVSHQLKALRQANLVKYRKEGKVVFYSLADKHVEIIINTGLEHLNE